MTAHPRTWVILSDKRGDNGQVETIVEALPWPVVDVTGIAELKTIRRTDDGWRIGAAASWRGFWMRRAPPSRRGRGRRSRA